ncbi:MAG: hypothetical protein ACTSW1_13715 [Candidatus Hodarchaeales archaeon]
MTCNIAILFQNIDDLTIMTSKDKMEDFWQNVASLTVKILETGEKRVLLNLSTERRIFVLTLLSAGSFALGWKPNKSITCV